MVSIFIISLHDRYILYMWRFLLRREVGTLQGYEGEWKQQWFHEFGGKSSMATRGRHFISAFITKRKSSLSFSLVVGSIFV